MTIDGTVQLAILQQKTNWIGEKVKLSSSQSKSLNLSLHKFLIHTRKPRLLDLSENTAFLVLCITFSPNLLAANWMMTALL